MSLSTRALTPLEEYPLEPFLPKEYVVPGSISRTHELPRFGRPNNFDALIEGGDGAQDAAVEYIVGIIIGSIIILCLALLWFLLIISFKIAGNKRVGFLAGQLVRPAGDALPHQQEQEQEQEQEGGQVIEAVLEEQTTAKTSSPRVKASLYAHGSAHGAGQPSQPSRNSAKFDRKVMLVRLAFVLSGLCVIASGGMFYGLGVVSFKTSLNEVRKGIDLVQGTATKAIEITDQVLGTQADIEDELRSTRSTVQDEAPLCLSESPQARVIQQVYDNLSLEVRSLGELVRDSLTNFSDDLRDLIALTDEIDTGLYSADIIFYLLVVISVVIIVIIVIMLVGVFFAYKGVNNCFTKLVRNLILWPIFIFLLVLSWAFATLFLVLSLAGADFCVQPDNYVTDVLRKNEDQFDSAIFGLVMFYVSGCTSQPIANEELLSIVTQLRQVIEWAHRLSELLTEQSIDQISDICGLNEISTIAFQSGAILLHDSSHAMNLAIAGVRDVLSCRSFNPIYTTFVHDAFCLQGVGGLTWIFTTTLCISIFSMLMIMFRAALYPIIINKDQSMETTTEVVKYIHNDYGNNNDNDDNNNENEIMVGEEKKKKKKKKKKKNTDENEYGEGEQPLHNEGIEVTEAMGILDEKEQAIDSPPQARIY